MSNVRASHSTRARNIVGVGAPLHSCSAARRYGDGPCSILSLSVASDDGMVSALSSLSYGVFIQVKKRLMGEEWVPECSCVNADGLTPRVNVSPSHFHKVPQNKLF